MVRPGFRGEALVECNLSQECFKMLHDVSACDLRVT